MEQTFSYVSQITFDNFMCSNDIQNDDMYQREQLSQPMHSYMSLVSDFVMSLFRNLCNELEIVNTKQTNIEFIVRSVYVQFTTITDQ